MNSRNLLLVYHQLLEEDIVKQVAKLKKIDLRQALGIYYKSRLAKQIEEGTYGIDCMSPEWLAQDLLENEPELFSDAPYSTNKE